MKKVLLITWLFLLTYAGFSQVWTEDFTTPTYIVTLGGEGTDGSGDYFMTTDGSDINKTYSGVGGNFFAGQDTDDSGIPNGASPAAIQWSGIDISGQTGLIFSGNFAEVFDDPGDIDNDDSLLVQYRIDGGNWTNLISFRNDGSQYNSNFYEDTDFDGIGDGTTITSAEGTMVTFTKNISETGNTIDIVFTAHVNSGDEDFAIDDFQLSTGSVNTAPSITNIDQTPSAPTSSDAVTVTADISDSDGTIATAELHWGTESGNLTNTIGMSTTRAAYATDTPIPAQADGTTVYYEIYAQDNDGGESTSAESNYTVADASTTTLPYNQTFDADLGDTYTYSVSGDTEEWYWNDENGNGVAAINGYNSGETQTDWLILPGINFDSYSDEVLTFETWYNYGTDNDNNYLKLYYSADYSGIGDPSTATWTELSYTQPANSETWASSGEIDLSAIAGTEVYIGFKYNYEGSYRFWEVDNIVIEEVSNLSPQVTNVDYSPQTVTSSDGVTVTADITDTDGTIAAAELHWGTESGNLTNTIGMSTSRAAYATDTPIPAQADGTTVYFEVYAQDNGGAETTSTEISYTVIDPATATLPYLQPFDTDLGETYTYSVSGDNKEWYWNDEGGNGVAAINGYSSGDTETDWMILPGINLDNYTDEVMSFETWYNYGSDDDNNYLKLYYSTDYNGIGDPSTATWTELSYTQPASSQTWAASGEIDLSAIAGTEVYVGFKYNYEAGNYRFWEVDDISIEEVSNLAPEITNIEYTPETVTSSDAVSVTADITDSDGTIQTAELHWGTTSGDLTNTINMSTASGDTYETDSDIQTHDDGTTVYFEVYAMDDGGAESTSSEQSYTVTDPATATLPYLQPFDADFGDTYTYNAVGDQEWYWNTFGNPDGSATMSGYDGGAFDNENWLITPSLDFSGDVNTVLNFDEAINYGPDNIDTEQEVYLSTDYAGIGDPSAATWEKLTVTGRASGDSWDFVSVDEVDLSAYDGETSVHIAFKYTSTTSGSATWEVDNISVEQLGADAQITVTSPNGGESWEQGSSQEITWTSGNLTGNVKIDLISSGTTTLTADTENDGTFTWDIPSDQTIADDYLVRITSVNDETVNDESDAAFSITAPSIPGELVITEIMYNPPESGSDSLEFIEIYNFGDFAVNLNGYYFDAGVEFIFPDYVLNSGEYVVVAINQTAFQDFFGVTAFEWTSGALSNGGEEIVLKDSEGTLIDEVTFSDAAPWPENADGDGPSLTLCDPSTDNSLAENWSASTEFAGLNDEDMLVLAKPGAPCGTSNLMADFDALETELSIGESATFIDLTSGGPEYWEWTFEGGTPENSNLQNPDDIVYNTAGTYDVTLTVYNDNGMDVITKEDFITVYDAPQADFTSDVTTIAIDGEVTFTDASTGNPASWEWTFEGGTPATYSGQTPPAVVYDSEGTYDVSLTVSNEYGETTELKEDYITVTLEPAANFEATETTLLVGESTTFSDLSSGNPSSWEWTFEGGDPASYSGQNPPAVTYNSEGSFDVTLVVSNDVGENTLVREDYIVAGYAPEADFEATPQTLLEGQSVTFTDMSANNPDNWSWIFDGGVPAASSAQNPVITYNNFGVFDVTLEVSNEFGSDAETKTEYIVVNGVGIEQLSLEEEKLIVYPNPATDIVNFVTLPNTKAQVRILSAVGKQILTKKITDEKTTMNVNHLPSGIYIVEMINTDNGQRITRRLIVK